MTTPKKYEDLAELIGEGANYANTTSFALGVECALRWLDDHPEACPGRTITPSEVLEAAKGRTQEFIDGYMSALSKNRVTVIPDPEPTNAQSIDKLLIEFAQLNASCGGEQGDHDLAVFLDARGVKAGGGDE